MIAKVPMRAALGLATTIVASCLAVDARAEDASPWQRDGHSAARLLAGSRSGAVLMGGVAFQLQPGWKTYWRTPGDSGVPPRFDFSKSENIEADTVPKPANVGDPNPLTIRDVKREGKSTVLVDVAVPDTRAVDLFVEGPTPDWALPVPKLLEHSPPGVKRFAFELEGLPPGTNPEGAALKLTLVGGDRAYEFNINLD